MPPHSTRPSEQRAAGHWRRRLRERAGLLGALLLFLAFSMIHWAVVTPLRPGDERAHVAYSLSLLKGELPTVESQLDTQLVGRVRWKPGNNVWVANHPPLYYTLVALPLSSATDLASMKGAVRIARAISFLLGALGLVYVYLLVELMAPRGEQRRYATAVTAITASTPALAHVLPLVHNDCLALLTCMGTLLSALLIVQRGRTGRRTLWFVLWAVMAVLTRLSGVFAFIAATPLLLLPDASEPPTAEHRPPAVWGAAYWKAGLWRAALKRCVAPALAGTAILLSAGWFYWRNRQLYGDISGAERLFELFGRKPVGSFWQVSLNPQSWWHLFQELYTRLAGGVRLDVAHVWLPATFAALGGLGLLLAATRRALGWRPTRSQPDQGVELPALWSRAFWASLWNDARTRGWMMCLLFSGLVLFATFGFHARGGSLHGRYIIPIVWVGVFAVSVGLRRLLGVWVLLAALSAAVLTHLLVLDSYVRAAFGRLPANALELVAAAKQTGLEQPTPLIIAALGCLAVGVAVCATQLLRDAPPEAR